MLRAAHRRLVLAGILSSLSISTALAQTEKVYVTRTGKKYDRQKGAVSNRDMVLLLRSVREEDSPH
jgi:hypothetical protein